MSTEAIMRAVRREEVQGTLFADPQLSPTQELDFHKHQTDLANRRILGDSLLVMHSLFRREGMAGKVQRIYVDPPYGVTRTRTSSHWGKLGRWRYAKIHSPHRLESVLAVGADTVKSA